jgi:stage II sporulation protein E
MLIFMEAKTTLARRQDAVQGDFMRKMLTNAGCLLCGILVSRGAVLGSLAPFGASFAAVPRKYLLSSLLGTAFGYVLLKPSDSFRYLAVVAAIGGLRWLLGDLDKVTKSKVFAPLVAFVPIFATGVSLLFVSTSTLTTFADCVTEAVIAGAAAYFISTALHLAGDNRSFEVFSQQETASVVMSGCILILAFGSIAWQNISLGRIIAMLVILLCSRYGSVTGGAISGISTGAIFSIASRENGYICGGFAFGGLMAGLFSQLGKLGCAIAFVISNGVMCLAFGSQFGTPSGVLVESLAASAVFMVLPKEVGNVISPVFSSDKNTSLGEALRKNIVMRLDFASKAVGNVKNDVSKVSEKMKKLYSPTFDAVCEGTRNEVCETCGLKMYCYEHKGGVTRDDFARLEECLESNGTIGERDVEKSFVKNCCKKGEIARSMNANYREYQSALEAQQRITDVRSVVAGQFSGIGDILHDLADEFRNTMRCDNESAQRIISALTSLGAIVEECICLVSNGGRMSVELTLSNKSEKLSKGEVMREISRCCGRRFDLPTISREGNRIRIAMCEMPVFDVEIGSDQHTADNGKLCGDCINYFNDGFGKTYALVFDGNMAASVMTRLLRAGLSADSCLQIVNSALMVKSEDESLSTVDVTSVDLYTGKTTFKKAGAPVTFVKKNGRVTVREMPSLPAGILNGIKFSTDTVNLTTGDMIVMVSDGVITGDDKWLEKLIRTWNEGSTQDLAKAVVDEAVKHRKADREDDVTAVAIRITENGH